MHFFSLVVRILSVSEIPFRKLIFFRRVFFFHCDVWNIANCASQAKWKEWKRKIYQIEHNIFTWRWWFLSSIFFFLLLLFLSSHCCKCHKERERLFHDAIMITFVILTFTSTSTLTFTLNRFWLMDEKETIGHKMLICGCAIVVVVVVVIAIENQTNSNTYCYIIVSGFNVSMFQSESDKKACHYWFNV